MRRAKSSFELEWETTKCGGGGRNEGGDPSASLSELPIYFSLLLCKKSFDMHFITLLLAKNSRALDSLGKIKI